MTSAVTTANKRTERDEAERSPDSTFKRQKLVDMNVGGGVGSIPESVGAHELASAFALASLATLSPMPRDDHQMFESRDADYGDNHHGVPVSPDVRSPIRPSSKRVTFAENTKNANRLTSRKLSLPARIVSQQVSRMPPGFVRAPYPHPVSRQMQHIPPPWMRPAHHQRLMMHSQPPPPPQHPQSLFLQSPVMQQAPPSPPQASDKWICDFCNVAAFDTYHEACVHEETCRTRMHERRAPFAWHPMMNAGPMYNPMGHPSMMPPPPSSSSHGVRSLHHRPVVGAESRLWCQGVTSLAIPESDQDWLSPLNCFIRDKCVEVFSASADDVNRNTKLGRISIYQVGLRCVFCKHRPKDATQVAAVSFPVSVDGIYESVKRWQKVHLDMCEDVPGEIKNKLNELNSANSWVPTTRQYWADSARSIGMVDTHEGIRFGTDPNEAHNRSRGSSYNEKEGTGRDPHDEMESRTDDGDERSTLIDGDNIVHRSDMPMVPAYVYFLMRQVEATHFTEADRFVARSKGPVGYSGFQCRHCHGHAGLGKYFPISSKSLSTNSTSQNIHSHLLKCRKVTPYIKEQLTALKEEKSKAPRLEPGWRRVFFEKIWARLHGETSC
jgi:hypothetical protein